MDPNEWEKLLDEILNNEDAGLYGSEMGFVEDLDNRCRGKKLSEKQWAWLERIWQKVNG